jgi:hypothetical protein
MLQRIIDPRLQIIFPNKPAVRFRGYMEAIRHRETGLDQAG